MYTTIRRVFLFEILVGSLPNRIISNCWGVRSFANYASRIYTLLLMWMFVVKFLTSLYTHFQALIRTYTPSVSFLVLKSWARFKNEYIYEKLGGERWERKEKGENGSFKAFVKFQSRKRTRTRRTMAATARYLRAAINNNSSISISISNRRRAISITRPPRQSPTGPTLWTRVHDSATADDSTVHLLVSSLTIANPVCIMPRTRPWQVRAS